MFDEEEIKGLFPEIVFDEPMSRHTTFRVGGKCNMFLETNTDNTIKAVKYCIDNSIPMTVIGNGSNTLCSDDGIDGMVICIGSGMNEIRRENNLLYAQAGCKLSKLAAAALEAGLGGLEFASGIPGNVGGALYMNAGAYGGEMKNVVKSVTFFENGDIKTLNIDELDFGYRKTYFTSHEAVILSCVIECAEKPVEEIKRLTAEYTSSRKSKQPLEYPSAGSFFKRPDGYFAGKLIQDSGLMGFSVGGAQVSEKHAGFIINKGGATCDDIVRLSDYVTETVYNKFGVKLEPEVRFIGRKKR